MGQVFGWRSAFSAAIKPFCSRASAPEVNIVSFSANCLAAEVKGQTFSAASWSLRPTKGHPLSSAMTSAPTDVVHRARLRIALRLLPFVFLIYIVNYIDRVNV